MDPLCSARGTRYNKWIDIAWSTPSLCPRARFPLVSPPPGSGSCVEISSSSIYWYCTAYLPISAPASREHGLPVSGEDDCCDGRSQYHTRVGHDWWQEQAIFYYPKQAASELDDHGVEWLQHADKYGRRSMPPTSLAHLRRRASEKKWPEARSWCERRHLNKG